MPEDGHEYLDLTLERSLAGFVPYSRFGTEDLVPAPAAGQRLADVEVETRFN